MNNVHDDAPVVFQTRWALSYLRGPLTRDQIETLMSSRKAPVAAAAGSQPPPATRATAAPAAATAATRPVIPPGIEESFLRARSPVGGRLVYRPALLGTAQLHYVDSKAGIDKWVDVSLLSVSDSRPGQTWDDSVELEEAGNRLEPSPDAAAAFASLPSEMSQPKQYASWKTALKNHLYQHRPLPLFKCPELKLASEPDESERDFRVRVSQLAHEQRDQAIDKLRQKYAPKLAALQDRIRRAEQQVESQKSQAGQQTLQTALSFGKTVLGALFGRKLASATNVNRAASSMRSASRVARERGDVARAKESVNDLQERLAELEQGFQRETEQLKGRWQPDQLAIDAAPLRPRKSDISISTVALVWTPWHVDDAGIAQPAW
jgi:hypothetical protein